MDGPLRENPQRRHIPRWIVWCAVILALATAGAGIFIGVISFLKSSEPFRMTMMEIRGSEAIEAMIGSGIEPGFLVTGSVSYLGSGGGEAELRIPVTGSKGEGVAFSQATRNAGTWRLDSLAFKPGVSEPPIMVIDQ